METVGIVALVLTGLLLIIKGGDMFVSAASLIAEASGVPKFIIGATVVSLATTLPEILVSLLAAAKGSGEMAVGNAIGSVNANLGLILALAFICMPSDFSRKSYGFTSVLLLAAIVLLLFVGPCGGIALGLLIMVFLMFTWHSIRESFRHTSKKSEPAPRGNPTAAIGRFLLGAGGIALGARMLVQGGERLALEVLGVSPRVVAVTVIAVGTCLPELATTLTALCKGQAALSIGNILGANVIDLTLILPLCRLVANKPLQLPAAVMKIDLPFLLVLSAIALIPALIKQKTSRKWGLTLGLIYLLYIIVSCG